MKIIYSKKGSEFPFEESSRALREDQAYSGDYWGAFSLEWYARAFPLWNTHNDAQGWVDYATQFNPVNFWLKDWNVRAWAYYEDYDNWQDTYGMDAVNAVYHSGHGGIDAQGVFRTPMGRDWGDLGTTVYSDKMQLGNEQVNYIFWSTCYSCRVSEGHTPIRTWGSANKGFRMLFGYESTSVDSPNYGKYFWEEWNKGKPLSTAFLDASWRIHQGQSPAVVACGADKDEAKNRLYTEREFHWEHVSTDYWYWRWYTADDNTRDPNYTFPKDMMIAELQPVEVDEQYVRSVVNLYNVEVKLPGEVVATREGIFSLKEGDIRAAFGENGLYEVKMAKPNLSNTEQISLRKARSLADKAVKEYSLDKEVGLTFDRVRLEGEGGGTKDEREREGPYMTGTTVQFKQVINGLPVLTPGAGEVTVSIDNDGVVTGVHASTRFIDKLTDRPKNTIATPLDEGFLCRPRAEDMEGCEELLKKEWKKLVSLWKARGKAPEKYAAVPGFTEIGYDIQGNEAVLAARQVMEVDFGDSYHKLYWVVTPLLG